MYGYTINLSEKFREMVSGFCSCGPMGIPKYLKAENVIDALTRVFDSAPVEVTMDLSGEWIEIVEDETGSVYRHMITKIPDLDRYLGDFEYNGVQMVGIDAGLKESEEIFPNTFCLFITRAKHRDDRRWWGHPENLISDIMPPYYIKRKLDEISGYEEDDDS